MNTDAQGWVDIFEFTDAREFLMHLVQDIALDAAAKAERGFIFRGQRDATWGLVPRSRRKGALGSYGLPDVHITLQEEELFRRFVRAADARGLDVRGSGEYLELDTPAFEPSDQPVFWLRDEHLPMACLAQHHGLPTPLLDWSRDPLIAAYFAASDATMNSDLNGDLAVWVVDRRKLEFAAGILTTGRGGSRSGTAGVDGAWLRIVQVPRFGNVNLHAQAGLSTLLLPPYDQNSLEDAARSEYNKVAMSEYPEQRVLRAGLLRKLVLSQREAPELLGELARLGASAASAFPGYASLDLFLKEQALWRARQQSRSTSAQ